MKKERTRRKIHIVELINRFANLKWQWVGHEAREDRNRETNSTPMHVIDKA